MSLFTRPFSALVLALPLLAAACSGGDASLVTQGCATDTQCNAGDVCIDGTCEGAALRRSDALLVSPTSASRRVTAGVPPQKGWFSIYNLTEHGHGYVVACDSGAAPTPAGGTLAANSKQEVLIDLQPPPAGDSKVTCSVTSSSSKTGYGSFTLALHARGGGSPDFSVAASPASLTLAPGASGTSAVAVTPSSGFTGDVALVVDGVPAGATAGFDHATVSGGSGSATLTIDAGSAAVAGATLTVTATSGSLSHTTAIELAIQQPPPPPPPPPAGDFALAFTPASLSLDQGTGGQATLAVAGSNGFAGPVALSVSGAPKGATASIDQTSVAAGGSATVSIAAGTAAAGSYAITVSGTSGSLAHTASLALAVTVPAPTPDFTLTAAPGTVAVTAGAAAGTATATVAAIGAFTRDVSLTVTGLPSGVTGSFDQPTLHGGSGAATLTLQAGASAAAGRSTLTLTGSAGSQTHSTTIALSVAAAPPPADFSLALSPGSLSIVAGASGTSAISISGVNGFSSAVSLSVSGLPSGATGSFSPSSVTGSGSSTLTITAGSAAGSGTATVTASGAGKTHTAQLAVTVTAAQCTTDTWSSWASGFFASNCSSCHSWAGSYASVASRQSSNVQYITDGSMPPGGGLNATDKARILKWLGCGSPQ